jgi:hypothetical protein
MAAVAEALDTMVVWVAVMAVAVAAASVVEVAADMAVE